MGCDHEWIRVYSNNEIGILCCEKCGVCEIHQHSWEECYTPYDTYRDICRICGAQNENEDPEIPISGSIQLEDETTFHIESYNISAEYHQGNVTLHIAYTGILETNTSSIPALMRATYYLGRDAWEWELIERIIERR